MAKERDWTICQYLKQERKRDAFFGQGDDFTDEEREFLMAIDRYKREQHRPYPTWREVLAVLKSLGYRRVSNAPGSGVQQVQQVSQP